MRSRNSVVKGLRFPHPFLPSLLVQIARGLSGSNDGFAGQTDPSERIGVFRAKHHNRTALQAFGLLNIRNLDIGCRNRDLLRAIVQRHLTFRLRHVPVDHFRCLEIVLVTTRLETGGKVRVEITLERLRSRRTVTLEPVELELLEGL